MFKKKLFNEESDEEVTLKTENEYAKKYDAWRGKEEIHKLEQKYGPKALSSDASTSSDSEDESDEPPEVSEETETQFLKTLALLKTKDPRIYDPGYKFFEEKEEKEQEKEPKAKTITFEDSDDDDNDEEGGNIFTIEKKAEINSEKEKPDTADKDTSKKEGKLKDYLIGKAEHVDEEVEQDLAPLKALWSDPKLNEGEAFLRDYILDKRYLEEGDVGEAEDKIRDDEDLEEDERRVEEQGKFERAYNFRFEEPDEEYLKRFPRTMNYIRPKDDKRSRKRAEIRARKDEEKRKKMEEIARLKSLKLKEIQEKIARIKEVTGNQELAFKDEDIEGDFDPEEHDRRMRAIFDEEYYGDADDQKPVFPDLDEELEIENWDTYVPEADRSHAGEQDEDGPHCDDEDFNMDAEYDPKQARANLLEEIKRNLGKKRRVRKKKSKLASLLASDKPKFIPTVADKTYSEYMEEYYKMDCEDIVGGDLPTRFKYREVVPNDYGLSIEEILLADDKELTQWVPLKKIVRHRPAEAEKGEVNAYRQKAADARLKRKMLPSLFKDLPEEPELVVPVEETRKKKKKKKKNKSAKDTDHNAEEKISIDNTEDINAENRSRIEEPEVLGNPDENITKKKKRKHKEVNELNNEEGNFQKDESPKKKTRKITDSNETELNNSNLEANDIQRKQKEVNKLNNVEGNVQKDESPNKNKKRKKPDSNETELYNSKLEASAIQDTENTRKENKKSKHKEIEYPKETSFRINEEGTEAIKEGNKKKKKHKPDGFVVENVQNAEPSRADTNENFTKQAKKNKGKKVEGNSPKGNLKRKLDTNARQIPNKKTNKSPRQGNFENKKVFKTKKFNQKDKYSKSKDKTSDNPLSKLSDERLKAYGLNPKKYRSFLKYKKF